MAVRRVYAYSLKLPSCIVVSVFLNIVWNINVKHTEEISSVQLTVVKLPNKTINLHLFAYFIYAPQGCWFLWIPPWAVSGAFTCLGPGDA